MQARLNQLSLKWWAPLISHALLYATAVVPIPILALDLLNSRTLAIIAIIVCGIGAPLLLAKIHKASMSIAVTMELASIAGIFWSWPKEQMGNWKLQIASHFAGWIFLALVGCAIAQSAYLFKKRKLG